VGFDRYTSGEYLDQNPSWHVEDSHYKADQILRLLDANAVPVKRVCDVGCGAGEVLRRLHDQLGPDVEYIGLDVSPQAIELAKPRETPRLRFELRDVADEPDGAYDLLLLMDVIEHVQDPSGLLSTAMRKASHTLLHIPLDLSALTVARPHSLVGAHDELGHVHFFVKETALQFLSDLDAEVIDWRYTTILDMDRPSGSRKLRALNAARRLLRRLSPELSAHLLGGFSLLALVRPAR
jgi:2-polyprenyl-3-methyl-5-hydroxy-6-metoxy-1,4-benzoquinol methylase